MCLNLRRRGVAICSHGINILSRKLTIDEVTSQGSQAGQLATHVSARPGWVAGYPQKSWPIAGTATTAPAQPPCNQQSINTVFKNVKTPGFETFIFKRKTPRKRPFANPCHLIQIYSYIQIANILNHKSYLIFLLLIASVKPEKAMWPVLQSAPLAAPALGLPFFVATDITIFKNM